MLNQDEGTKTWMLDEGREGPGDRPEWLPEKFKSAAEMAKSYHELEKKFGAAPEEYDISNSKFLDKEYKPLQETLQLAKDRRVPKEVVDKFVESFDSYIDSTSIKWEDEQKKLGDNAPERLKTLDNWAKANLSNDAYKALTSNLRTADSIQALEELRSKMLGNTPMVPPDNGSNVTATSTVADLERELADNMDKYKTDPKWRDEWRARLTVATARAGNMIDKTGP